MSDVKITYLFLNGRIERIRGKKKYPVEMFYGYQYLKSRFLNVSIIEAKTTNVRAFIQKNIEHRIGHILRIPILFSEFTSFINYFKLRKSDVLIFSNHRTLISAYPMLFINKLFGKSLTSIVFFMGLLKEFPKNRSLHKFKIFFITKILKFTDKVFFLNKSELQVAVEHFPSFKDIFEYYPFSVDLNFWKNEKTPKSNDVLFIGNDGERDYDAVISLVNKLDSLSFTVVSRFIDKSQITNERCKVIQGSWNDSLLSDIDILELYNISRVTIVPLKESLQPSGQSVALQSMACGTPVVITKTQGFWDFENFIDNKNICFARDNSLEEWEKKINFFLKSSSVEYSSFSNDCEKLIKEKYSLDNINKKLESFINNL